ncbi:MAG: signal peptidase II [Mobilitalea sp.]
MLYILIVAAVVILEYNIKSYIEKNRKVGERQEILGGKIIIRKEYNDGAFMNFMEDKKETVKTISSILLGLIILLFTIMLPKKGNKVYKLGLSFIVGGAISNVYDRITHGHVIDYFSINCKKLKTIIFNLADMAIFLGSILIVIASMFAQKSQSGTDKTSK